MNRFLLISVGTLSCILLGVLFGGYSVSAASIYDNAYKQTDKILIQHPECETIDITNTITTYFLQENRNLGHSWYNQAAITAAYNAFENRKGWSVGQVNQSAGSSYGTFTFHTRDIPPQLKWWPDAIETTQSITLNVGYGRQYTTSGGYSNCNIATWPIGSGTEQTWTASSSNVLNLLIYNYNLNLPEDYEGTLPPDSNVEECLRECRIVIAPNFEYDYDDKQISVNDLENDLLPEFEPDEGYTSLGYEIEWSLWKCTVEYDNGLCKNGENELVELKHTPLLEGNTWNNLDYGYYRVEAQYVVQQCYRYPSYPATPDYCFYVDLGTEFGKVYLFEKRSRSINLDGTSGSGNTSDENCDVSGECTSGTVGGLLPCFGPDPPYVQVDGCVKNIFWVVDSLSFSKITIMEIKSNTIQCKQLDTIGGWINRPGITVCPMFPSHVRDVVTPFITLAIGLFLGSFIMRLASRGVR